ncbi:MAG: conjugative relaxase [Caldithrix sp.]|nr:MAG: conjugative relaxase [Caldithrix sp.]
MVSLTNISPAQASKYFFESKDNYYTRVPGEWFGKGAEWLELRGSINKDDFEKLVNGENKAGNLLIEPGDNKKHRAGIDLTFSAPKSVSITAEILDDTRIYQAHDKAVNTALQYLEEHFAQARKTTKGVTRFVDTGNLVIAKFQHDLSRELDPQTHTHCVVLNITRRPDGNWRAISNEELYYNKMLLGQIYRNDLALNLKELGYQVEAGAKGLFELKGIPDELIKEFSKRSRQIEAKAKELEKEMPNANEQKLKEMAAVDSRSAKKNVDMEWVKQDWERRLAEKGFKKERLAKRLLKQKTFEKTMLHHVNQALNILSERESVFSREEIVATALKLSLGEKGIEHVEQEFKTSRELRSVTEGFYTTREIKFIERDIVDQLLNGYSQVEPAFVSYDVQKTELDHLTHDQKKALKHILTSNDRVTGIQGDAGTGKTTMLSVASAEFRKTGFEVTGLSLTAKAVDELNKVGIRSQTIDSFLVSGNNEATTKRVLIVDEASLLGSKKFYHILNQMQEHDRVILVGDVKQLQSIEAGGIFRKLQELKVIKTARMAENIRQKTEHMKQAAIELAEKRVDKAFKRLDNKERFIEIASREERIHAVAEAFTENCDKDKTLVIVKSNQERIQINEAIRNAIQKNGRSNQRSIKTAIWQTQNLSGVEKSMAMSYRKGDHFFVSKSGGGLSAGAAGTVVHVDREKNIIQAEVSFRDKTKVKKIDLSKHGLKLNVYRASEREFTKGDKIVFLKNDRKLAVENGRIGKILALDSKGNMIVRTEQGKEVSFNTHNYAYFDHGYAVTEYKSLGQTTNKVLYVADTRDMANYNSFYVAATRGREDMYVFTNDKAELQEQVMIEQIKTSTLDFDKQLNFEKQGLLEDTNEKSFEIGIDKVKNMGFEIAF